MSYVSGFLNKCIQLFETTVVRHGLMLVGPAVSGKTKVRKGEVKPRRQTIRYLHHNVI